MMAARTSIAWTNKTFNPWWGCVKVSPACDHCYAEAQATRYGHHVWGAGTPRRYFSDKHWAEPLKWHREAMVSRERVLVFCASMADVFDNEVDQSHRDRLWQLIRETPCLTWQIVTKRIGNAPKMLPADWHNGYPNVWLCSTVVTQTEADRDIPKLAVVPARIHGLSIEPQLELIDLTRFGLDSSWWVICGGESGPRARPFLLDWARSLCDQCAGMGVPFFFKQTGRLPDGVPIKGKGEDPSQWPADLRVREFP